MDHAGNERLCLRFDRETVAPVAHGNDGVLQIASGRGVVDHGVHLCADLIVHSAHGAPDRSPASGVVVGNAARWKKNSSAAIRASAARGRLDAGKKTGQGIVRLIVVVL